MTKKKCELCGGVARMYCESDQASLCWDCDHKVHGANFLVAKHTRCLLCSTCQSPTPWKASGPRLAPTLSDCDSCASLHPLPQTRSQGAMNGRDCDEDRFGQGDGVAESYDDGDEDDEEDDDDDEEYADEEEEEDEDEDEDEEAENQVVPWGAAALQPPAASSSSSVSSGGGGWGGFAAKRNSDHLFSSDV